MGNTTSEHNMNSLRNLTDNQRRVLQALSEATGPLGAYALLERLDFSGLTQVYRALDRLIALGLVQRLESLNAYVPSSEHDASHPTAFAICDQCGISTTWSTVRWRIASNA